MAEGKDVLSFAEASDYLGLHKQTLEKHQRTGRLTPSVRFASGQRGYYLEDLRRFQSLYQSQMLTMKDIASTFGVTEDAVLYNFKRKRHMIYDAERSGAGCYAAAKILMIARSEGWIVKWEEVPAKGQDIGCFSIAGSDRNVVYGVVDGILIVYENLPSWEEAREQMRQYAMYRVPVQAPEVPQTE